MTQNGPLRGDFWRVHENKHHQFSQGNKAEKRIKTKKVSFNIENCSFLMTFNKDQEKKGLNLFDSNLLTLKHF